jgi:hypothetical protein
MYYPKEQRLEIGRRVYTKEISLEEASAEYSVPKKSVYRYIAEYKEEIGLQKVPSKVKTDDLELDMDAYMAMSKEELIRELILAKADTLRAKKGYEVKGDGTNKEFVPLNNKNSKS